MKNKHICGGDLVPENIRLSVYRKAAEIIREKIWLYQLSEPYLCLLLPCILWELNSFLDKDPNDNIWHDPDTTLMFPELTKDVIRSIESTNTVNEANNLRLEFLKQFIANLTAQNNENN